MSSTDAGALVTGGSGAIGSAVAAELARAGMDVTVGYRSSEAAAETVAETVREHGQRAQTVAADVTDADAVDRLAARTADFASLSVVVNSAGVTEPRALDEHTEETLRQSLRVNTEGAVMVARASVPHLRETDGAIVNVSSVAAEIGTVDVAYASSKAGILGATRALARELGADGIRVNAVCPGPVDTPMNDRIVEHLESQRFRGHDTVDTLLDRYEAQPEEVATAVRFLATHEFVTGETLRVDGGLGL